MIAVDHPWLVRIRSWGLVPICNFAIMVFACWVFLAVADEVREEEYQEVENRIMLLFRDAETLHPIGPEWLESVARDITALGSTVVLASVVVLAAGFLTVSRRYSAVAFIAAASIGGLLLNNALKAGFGRERPDEALRLVDIDSLSFPSGHAMSSATIYLALAVLLTRLADRRREKIYILGAALLVSFFVGFTRVYLGVHYPTDVIGGWAAGVAWAQVCWFTAHLVGRRRLARIDAA